MKKAIESKKSEVSSDVVSRAENKLAGASQAFSFDFRDKTVLDIGSSTGGFTEYALRRGAKRVFAVEKGTNQMKAPLRFDPRITLLGGFYAVWSTRCGTGRRLVCFFEKSARSCEASVRSSVGRLFDDAKTSV